MGRNEYNCPKLAEDGREKDLNEMISKRVADLNAKLKMAMKEELKGKSDT